MVNENIKPIIENKKPTETVCEIPSFEEFMKDYKVDENVNYADLSSGSVGEAKGYGPGKKNSLKLWESEEWSSEENGDKKWFRESSVKGRIGLGGPSLDINNSVSYLKGDNGSEEYSLFGVSAESSFTIGDGGGLDAKTNLGLDLYKFKDKDKKVSIRPNIDTGISKGDGSLGVKAAGFGLSVGKQTGISLPLGEVKVDTDDCVIQ